MMNLESLRYTSVENLSQPSVYQLAREGHFRAVAYWINAHLVPQGIYVCVSSASQPGYLLVLVEFQRIPDRDRLIRFICHRLCKLNSEIILGVQIVARQMGSSTVLWHHSVRLLTSNSRYYARTSHLQQSQRTTPRLNVQKTAQTAQETALAIHGYLKQLQLQEHLKNPRSQLLLKSAIAAFIIGCGFEAAKFGANAAIEAFEPLSTRVAAGGDRSDTVQAALEKINVTQLAAASTADPTVTLTFSGDGALAKPADQTTPEAQENSVNAATAPQADVVLVNLESPLTLPSTNLPANASPASANPSASPASASSLQALSDRGVNVVNLANEQLLESEPSRLAQTIRSLERAGIHPVGAGRNEREARRPEIIDVKGQRLAYLGYSNSDTNAAGAWSAGLNPGLKDQIAADIQAIREQVDWVVVNYHWNQELTEQPAEWQKDLAHFAIDQGADLVVGYHPDALQGAEVYQGRAIAYSLGNFIFDKDTDNPQTVKADYDTAVLKVSLREQQMRLEFLPVQVRQSKPQVVNGEKAAEIIQRIQQASEQFEQPLEAPITLDVRSQPEPSPLETPTFIEPESLPAPEELPLPPAEASPTQSPIKSSPPSENPASPNSFITYPDSPDALNPQESDVEDAEQPQSTDPESLAVPETAPDFNSAPQVSPTPQLSPTGLEPQEQRPTDDASRSLDLAPTVEPTNIQTQAQPDQALEEPATVEQQELEPVQDSPIETQDINAETAPIEALDQDQELPASSELEPQSEYSEPPQETYPEAPQEEYSEPVAEEAEIPLEEPVTTDTSFEEPVTEAEDFQSSDVESFDPAAFPSYPDEAPLPANSGF